MNTTSDTDIAKDTTTQVMVTGLKYLALGDSYTIGPNVKESERFPAQTAKILAGENIGVQSITYIATSGWTTNSLISAIRSKNLPKNFDIVTLLIGVNDQYQQVDTSTYRARFTEILNTSVELAGNKPSRVFVVSIPDYSVTPFVSQPDKARVSEEINIFNSINAEVTAAYQIAYINVTPASREAATDPSLIANDGLHPSGQQYAAWATLLAPVIKSAFK